MKVITENQIIVDGKPATRKVYNYDESDGQASTIIESQEVVITFDKKAIIGMNQKEVEEYFKKITGIVDIQVKFSPFWVRSVPNLEDHVDIEIKKN